MEYKRIKSIGYCPEQGCECTIEVEFRVFTQIGSSEPTVNKLSLKCPHQAQCQRQVEDCPLYQSSSFPVP